MKTCFKCNETKPLSEFYKHAMMGDGHLNKCKECTRHDSNCHRKRNLKKIRAYDRERGNRQPKSYYDGYKQRFPEKVKAKNMVSNAVRDGKIKKQPCFMCGNEKAEAHHPDYTKPLDVIWLCPPCHKGIHAYENKANQIRGLAPSELEPTSSTPSSSQTS